MQPNRPGVQQSVLDAAQSEVAFEDAREESESRRQEVEQEGTEFHGLG